MMLSKFRNLLLFILDMMCAVASFGFAYYFTRVELTVPVFLSCLGLLILVYGAVLFGFGIYRSLWRCAQSNEFFLINVASLVAGALYFLICRIFIREEILPLFFYLLNLLTISTVLVSMRLVYRVYRDVLSRRGRREAVRRGLLQRRTMIVGAGRIAFYLSKMLLQTGCSVTVVDKDRKVCEFFAEALPEAVIVCGDGAHLEVLLEEGLESMDAFVTLTGEDEENILLSFTATNHNVTKVISKVNREAFATVASKLGLDCMLSPKQLVANVIVRYARALENSIESSQVETLYKLMDGKAELLEFIIKSENEATGTSLKDLNVKSNTLVCGIIRNRKPIIPNGDDVIKPGDHVIVLTSGHRMNDITDILN